VRTVAGLIQASHPFPLFAVVALTGLIGVASAGDELDAGRLVRVLLAMLLAQLVIGWTNDYTDRVADSLHQPGKPIPSGRVGAGLIPPLAVVSALGAIAVAITLGVGPAVCVAVGLACGLGYNFRLKATPWSWAPFVVAFCVLPPFVWSGLGVWDDAFLALYPIALPLTVAAHLANALPDIDTDRDAGRSSIVVRLGRKGTVRALALMLVAPVCLVALSTLVIAYDGRVLLLTLALYATLLALTGLVYRGNDGRRMHDVWGFRLVAIESLIFVTGWLTAVK
jgi:4-hydroxybenzoate polyprenyltransferase